MQRGVFYTPRPIVSHIVHSVDELLRTEFGLEDGLADTTTWGEMVNSHPGATLPPLTDEPGETRTISPNEPFVQILDPATGTATFLVEVIEVIHSTLGAKWKANGLTDEEQLAAWNAYVPRDLLPRLHAFELMMAPYAIAHLKVGLKLAETGYQFGSEERVRIYLTNALEPWVKQAPLLGFDALAHEAAAVNEVKRQKRFTVVIGNPPYSNFGQLNRNPFILGLLEEYKRGLDDKKINLDDDFIKFIRFSHQLLNTTGRGVFGMITNNVFFDGLTHRRMRQCLVNDFDSIQVVDLHGSVTKHETAPNGLKDENVFDIQQGVGITILSKTRPAPSVCRVWHADIWGNRAGKYQMLVRNRLAALQSMRLEPTKPHFFFVPKDFGLASEYDSGWRVNDMFMVQQNCIKTDRDDLFFDRDRARLEARMVKFYSPAGLEPEFREAFRVEDSSSYALVARRNRTKLDLSSVHPCLYRSFDIRFLYYSLGLTSRPAWDAIRHMIGGDNLALLAKRQSKREPFSYIWCSQGLTESCVFESTYANNSIFPLYLSDEPSDRQVQLGDMHIRRTNLNRKFLSELADKLNLSSGGELGLPDGVTPEDIFRYAYAVFHSPSYRSRYAEFLKIDFPRLPLTGNPELFRVLARLGSELIPLHLGVPSKLDKPIAEFTGRRNPTVEKIEWANDTVWLDKAQVTGFRAVPYAAWDFRVGGYQVCEKWLKDRRGRTLTDDDVAHYRRIVVAVSETMRIMEEIETVIDRHGGWPGAFSGGLEADALDRAAEEPSSYSAAPEMDAGHEGADGLLEEDQRDTLWVDGTQLRGRL